MSYYTRFTFEAKLRVDAPIELINDLIYHQDKFWDKDIPFLYSVEERPDIPIEHEFGKSIRWPQIFEGASLINRRLKIDCKLKNYDSEIDKFVDWIKPFVKGHKKKLYLGQSRGETADYYRNYYKEL